MTRSSSQRSQFSSRQLLGRRAASTQQAFVGIDAVRENVLCLVDEARGSQRKTRRLAGTESHSNTFRFRAVVEVGSLNFALKSGPEQEAILSSYGAFLNSLSFPVQVLVRVLPLDLSPYLARLARLAQPDGRDERLGNGANGANGAYSASRVGGEVVDVGVSDNGGNGGGGDATDRETSGVEGKPVSRRPSLPNALLANLARDHARFVRQLTQRRTLLERRFYLVIPADERGVSRRAGRGGNASTPAGSLYTGIDRPAGILPPVRRHRRDVSQRARLLALAQKLDLRTSEVARQLGRMGLEARRLSGSELVELYAECLRPATQRAHPLRDASRLVNDSLLIPRVRPCASIRTDASTTEYGGPVRMSAATAGTGRPGGHGRLFTPGAQEKSPDASRHAVEQLDGGDDGDAVVIDDDDAAEENQV